MKRYKKLLVLTVIFAVSCLATFMLTKYEKRKEEIQNTDEVILALQTEDITGVSWENETIGFSFHKEQESWIYDSDESFPTDVEKITSILSHFEEFGAAYIIENVEDYAQYGLDDPEWTICLTTEDENYELKLGDFSKMDEQRYVDIGDGNVYLVSDDPAEYLKTEIGELICHDEVPSFETVSGIQFGGQQNYAISYQEESEDSYSTDDIYFTKKGGKNVPLDTENITDYLNLIATLDLDEYVTYNAAAEEVEQYGLDDPQLTVMVQYTYTDEDENEISDTFTMYVSSNKEEMQAAEKVIEENEGKEEDKKKDVPDVTRYVRIGDSKIIYRISESVYETLTMVSYDDLRHKEIFWGDFDEVTQIDIALEDSVYTITASGESDEKTWYYGENEIDVYDLKSAIKSIKADSFTDSLEKGKEEITLTLYLDHEKIPQTKIELYRYDGTNCLAEIDGNLVSLVDRSDVMELVEAVHKIVLD